jgi:hypothetical protein
MFACVRTRVSHTFYFAFAVEEELEVLEEELAFVRYSDFDHLLPELVTLASILNYFYVDHSAGY